MYLKILQIFASLATLRCVYQNIWMCSYRDSHSFVDLKLQTSSIKSIQGSDNAHDYRHYVDRTENTRPPRGLLSPFRPCAVMAFRWVVRRCNILQCLQTTGYVHTLVKINGLGVQVRETNRFLPISNFFTPAVDQCSSAPLNGANARGAAAGEGHALCISCYC